MPSLIITPDAAAAADGRYWRHFDADAMFTLLRSFGDAAMPCHDAAASAPIFQLLPLLMLISRAICYFTLPPLPRLFTHRFSYA